MKLYIESQMWGMYELGAKVEELTPEFIDAYIEHAKGFEKIGFCSAAIAELVGRVTSTEELIRAMMERYNMTCNQALLAILLPEHDDKLYFNRKEYPKQIERLKTLRQLVQEVQDVINKNITI